ncbi:hypothetical protein TWF696_001431 [Orbilia brochopaga]|uniref:F-box domain-containing protein n=1 Tax=Orbilia brochopaga TaxID=3140254 RepID=A0AAV9U8Y8_9PEZI
MCDSGPPPARTDPIAMLQRAFKRLSFARGRSEPTLAVPDQPPPIYDIKSKDIDAYGNYNGTDGQKDDDSLAEDAGLDSLTSTSYESIFIVQSGPFTKLSLDLLNVILDYLCLRDRIALSLTCKGLQHIAPLPAGYVDSGTYPQALQESVCVSKVTSRLLPPPPDPKVRRRRHRCPYCTHKLCPPTCSSALILDSGTGIFYPPSLYPVHCARFYYATNPPRRPPVEQFANYIYSTIWCEHHRCPRELFSQQQLRITPGKSTGPARFLEEYHHNGHWGATARRPYHQCFYAPSWLVGEKAEYVPPVRTMRTRGDQDVDSREQLESLRQQRHIPVLNGDKNAQSQNPPLGEGWLQPVHERFVYELWCTHCCRPLVLPPGQRSWGLHLAFLSYCGCNESATAMPGCRRCGVVTVKFTLVEVFDLFRSGMESMRDEMRTMSHRLFLATECRRSYAPNGSLSIEKERIVPADPVAAAAALRIVRGEDRIILPPPPPRLGVPQLPYVIIRRILELLLEDGKDPAAVQGYCRALQASYCFLKGYCGGTAVGGAALARLQERYVYSGGVSWPMPLAGEMVRRQDF